MTENLSDHLLSANQEAVRLRAKMWQMAERMEVLQRENVLLRNRLKASQDSRAFLRSLVSKLSRSSR